MFHSSLSFDDEGAKGLRPQSGARISRDHHCWLWWLGNGCCQVWSVSLCAVQQLIVVVFCLVQSSTVTCAMRSWMNWQTRRSLSWVDLCLKQDWRWLWLVVRNPFSSFLKPGRQIVWASSVGRLTDWLSPYHDIIDVYLYNLSLT